MGIILIKNLKLLLVVGLCSYGYGSSWEIVVNIRIYIEIYGVLDCILVFYLLIG